MVFKHKIGCIMGILTNLNKWDPTSQRFFSKEQFPSSSNSSTHAACELILANSKVIAKTKSFPASLQRTTPIPREWVQS